MRLTLKKDIECKMQKLINGFSRNKMLTTEITYEDNASENYSTNISIKKSKCTTVRRFRF